MYGQIYKIFGCFEGFYVGVPLTKLFSFVDDYKTSAYLNNDIFVPGIHLISQEQALRPG